MMDNKDIDFDKKHIHFYDEDIPNLLKKAIESKIKEEFNIVDLGCGDGKLTACLHANDSYLVHGLDTSEKNVNKARENIRSLGLYGKVSIDRFDGKKLPYIDNLVKLLVAEAPGDVSEDELLGEVLRAYGEVRVGEIRAARRLAPAATRRQHRRKRPDPDDLRDGFPQYIAELIANRH